MDYLLYEAEFQDENGDVHIELEREENPDTGQGFARLAEDTTIHFTNIQVKVTWRYYLVVRYAYDPEYSTNAFILTLTSNNMSTILADSRLQADSRSVTKTEALSLTANQLYNITVSLTSTTSDPVDDLLVDSLVLKPDLTPSRIRSE